MPKLPSAVDLGERPTPQPGRGVATYQATTGREAAPALAMADVGGAIAHAALVEQEKMDTTRVEDAWNQYKNAALDVTAGENGVLRKQGGDAVNGDIVKTAEKTLAIARKSIAEKLSPDQQRRFEERANATDYQVRHQTVDHLIAQQKVYADTVQVGRVATAATQVGAMPTDDRVFDSALSELVGKSLAYLQSKGVTDKGAQEAYIAEVRDKLLVKRIDTLLYNMPELAEAKFRGLADTISNPELRLQYQARTREVALGVVSTGDADKIINQVRVDLPAYTARITPGTRDAELKNVNEALKVTPNDPDLLAVKVALESGPPKVEGGVEVYAPTNGLPNSRDIAAQLPLALGRIEKMADQRYGPDRGNPDRAAYIAKTTTAVKAKISAEVEQLNAIQRQAQGILIDAITGIGAGAPAANGMVVAGGNRTGAGGMLITNFQQIQSNPALARAWATVDPQAKLGLERLMEHNMRANDAGDVRLYRDIFNRIHLPDGTPGKVEFYQQITDPAIADRLSMTQINALRLELDRNETPGGRSLNQLRKAADTNVANYFKTHVMFTAQPERPIAATMKWNEDVGRMIDDIVKTDPQNAGARVRAMFQTDNKASVVSPQFLESYVNTTPAQGLSAAAANAPTAATPANAVVQPATIDTREKLDAWFKTLPPTVTTFVGVDGKTRIIPKTAVKGTQDIAPDAAPAASAPTAGAVEPRPAPPGTITMDANGKITETPAAPAPSALVPPAADDDAMPKRIKPGSVADRYARSGAILEARRWENEARAYQRQQGFADSVMMVPVQIYQAVTAPGRALAQMIPTEDARVLSAFRDIIKRGYSELDADIIVRAKQLGSPFLSPKEIKKADFMLRELGVDENSSPGAGGSGGGGGGMTKAEADAAAQSGIFDDADRAARRARGADKQVENTGYKTGTDDARATGKSTKAQDEAFIALWMRNTGESRTRALAELARIKRKGK